MIPTTKKEKSLRNGKITRIDKKGNSLPEPPALPKLYPYKLYELEPVVLPRLVLLPACQWIGKYNH